MCRSSWQVAWSRPARRRAADRTTSTPLADDGPEEFPTRRVLLVSGRLLTWHGPSLATARADLLSAIGRP